MSKYYSSKRIREHHATYNLIFGERSNGKTFDILKYGLEKYFKSGMVETLALIRRWDTDYSGANSAKTSYDGLMCDGNKTNQIKKISKGLYDGVEYYNGRFYLTKYDEAEQKMNRTDKVIAYAFAINTQEHYKSAQFPTVTTILFDEFITRGYYLVQEFVQFTNLLSTIIRDRDNVEIYMCGNTVNKYCPYFTEMGLRNVKTMAQGDIDVYEYGNTGLTVAVEFVAPTNEKLKKSNKYFAFDNPHLNMITTGSWEIDIYPHCPHKLMPKDIIYTFFINFTELLQCDVIYKDDCTYVFVHEKTTPVQEYRGELYYSPEPSPLPNHHTNILVPSGRMEKAIIKLFENEKIFFQDNEIGESVNNYLKWCKKNK